MNRTSSALLAATLAAAVLVAAPVESQAKLRVVTTTQDLAWFVRSIGGAEVDAANILKGFQDPHFAAAKPSYMVEISRADLLLYVGMDLEIGWLPLIMQGARNPTVMPGEKGSLDCSQFVTPIEVPVAGADRSKGDLHPKGNPHYWLDPDNAKQLARGIADRLTLLEPEQAATFKAGLDRVLAEIDRADTEARAIIAAGPVPPIVTYHVTFSYFFKHYGLQTAGFIETKPGIPPTPSHVAGLVSMLQGLAHPPVVLVEPYYDLDVPRKLGDQTGGRVVVTASSIGGTDAVKSYRDLFVGIANAIVGK